MILASDQNRPSETAPSDDPFLFIEESDDSPSAISTLAHAWRIVVTDDDEEVHRATAFALRGVEVDGRPLQLLHAHSAKEAEEILKTDSDIAVAMLDVVMETPHAGLELVRVIRHDLGLKNIRIVLRTGQPGYAPELEVIRSLDINDYRTKSELTQTRLITTLTAAIRAYAQLEQIEASNRGLTEVARASNSLFRIRSAREFARALLDRLVELLRTPAHGFVCLEPTTTQDHVDAGVHIVHGAGRFAPLIGARIDTAVQAEVQKVINRCVAAKTCVFEADSVALWLGSGARDAVAYIELGRPLYDLEKRLLEVFAANLVVGFENVDLFERLDFFAFFDPLTHLPNRTRFLADVDQDLFSRHSASRILALADVVRFSDINDALGHRCGDTLLIGIGKRLRAAVGSGVTMARIAGDAFGLFGPEDAIDPTAIRHAFEAPFFVHGHALAVQMRLGVVRVADSKGSAVELLRNANLALNEARAVGGGVSCAFTRGMSEEVQARVSMLHSLRAAIDFRRGLFVHYQPQVNARTNEVVGVEALLRWRNDYGEMIPPDRFIPLAERTGMINELGLWVMEEALDRLSTWHGQGLHGLRMSINISAVQFRADDFVDKVKQIIALCDVPAHCITLEVTESVGLEDNNQVCGHLNALRDLGVRCAIDDFGTGYSSLTQLTRLPADILKIDRAFVQTIDADAAERAVAATIIMLAQTRQLGLIAEGVENASQMRSLLELGCDTMQGFFFARPMAAEDFDAWMQGRSAVNS